MDAAARASTFPRPLCVWALGLAVATSAIPHAQAQRGPGQAASRREVRAIVEARTGAGRPATLGLLRDAVEASIAFGAPAYNRGEVASCARFYQRTAEDLRAAFPKEQDASPDAQIALAKLGSALARSKKEKTGSRAAWAMRYAFDRVIAAWDARAMQSGALMHLGDNYFRRAQFEEARDAFEDATELLEEIERRQPDQVPLDHRLAPFALAHTHFALGHFEEAARTIERGLSHIPDWPSMRVDRRGFHRRPEEYDRRLKELKTLARKRPRDTEIQFLLGYELAMTGDRRGAVRSLERTLELSPRHRAARAFLDSLKSEPPPPRLRRGVTAT